MVYIDDLVLCKEGIEVFYLDDLVFERILVVVIYTGLHWQFLGCTAVLFDIDILL